MNEKPILFSGPMVRAILEGRKTQTRRVVKHKNDWYMDDSMSFPVFESYVYAEDDIPVPCPFGYKGTVLWVRETWCSADCFYQDYETSDPSCIAYKSDMSARQFNFDRSLSSPVEKYDIEQWNWEMVRWKPSIHMPRWASRIDLLVKDIRVERLQDIGQGSACSEGCPDFFEPIRWFRYLWDSINGKRDGCSWRDNPWVWVVEFEKMDDQYINPDMVDCTSCRCPKCDNKAKHYEDLRGDFHHKCVECGYSWFIDGSDY